MKVIFRPISTTTHVVTVERADGSVETVELATKDFLRHDLAHFVVESVLNITDGVWGRVAAGASLNGQGLDNSGVMLAERIAGPMQTMMRLEASPKEMLAVLLAAAPEQASEDIAQQLHDGFRTVVGHWRATKHGRDMCLIWPLKHRAH